MDMGSLTPPENRSTRRAVLVELLAQEGFVAAEEDADDLIAAAAGDTGKLTELVRRRLSGEPVAWIVGQAMFCGYAIHVEAGVYVPRWQSEPLARRAVQLLPDKGIAVDLCTGSGAIAVVLRRNRPGARVLATEIDAGAAACATANDVEVYMGDLFAGLPPGLEGRIDVVTGVLPYVPTSALRLLPRDTLEFESSLAYDGGDQGTQYLRRAVAEATRYLRTGGTILLELGDRQDEILVPLLASRGYHNVLKLHDDEGDLRGIEGTYLPSVLDH